MKPKHLRRKRHMLQQHSPGQLGWGKGESHSHGERGPPLPSLPSCSGDCRQMGFPQCQDEHLALLHRELQVSLSSPAGWVGRSPLLREPQSEPGSPLLRELTAPEAFHGPLP